MIVSEDLTFKSVIRSVGSNKCVLLSTFMALIITICMGNAASAHENVILKSSDARYVSKLDVWITLSGEISFYGEGELLELNLSIPCSNEWQNVLSYPQECELVRDEDGNTICRLRIENPPNIYRYELRFHVISKSFEMRRTFEEDDPSTGAYPPEIQRYLQPTEHIQSDALEIRALARTLTQNATNEFEKVAALAIWVNENVKYDERYATENKDALWVLKNRKGVCAEYTTLFIALARAIGIPARYAHIYAFGRNGWESHAIAEVYIGKRWVPVDVLWLEVGNVDATHIYMGSYLDNRISNNIRVEGYGVRNVEWNVEEPRFEIISAEEQFPRDDVELHTTSPILPPDSSGIVWVRITPSTTKVDKLLLLPCKGADLLEVTDTTTYVTEWAGKDVYHYWIIRSLEHPDPRYEYICPLTLNTFYTDPKALPVEIKISPLEKTRTRCWSASLLKLEVQNNAEVGVAVNTEGCATPLKLYVGNDAVLKCNILQSETRIFFLPQTSSHKVFVFDEHGNYQVLNYVTNKVELPYIASVSYPKVVYNGGEIAVRVRISNPSGAKNLTVKIASMRFPVNNEKNEVVVNISSEGAGERMLWAKLLLNGVVVDAVPVVYKVVERTEMEVRDAYAHGNSTFLLVSINNPCYNLTVLAEGEKYAATPTTLMPGNNRIVVNASLSGKNVELVCFDEMESRIVWRGELKSSGFYLLIDQIKKVVLPFMSELLHRVNSFLQLVLQAVRG